MTIGYTIPMNLWADDDRPDTKLMLKGVESLSDAELLSMIMGNNVKRFNSLDVARRLLSANDNCLSSLAKMTPGKISGYVNEEMALRLYCAFEIGRRRLQSQDSPKVKVTSSLQAFDLFRSKLQDKPYEEFWIILLNRANRFISMVKISEGGISGTTVDPKKVFKIALDHHATAIILGHNHPSGNCVPSEADQRLTAKLIAGGRMLDITVLDHIIVADPSYYSFADRGDLECIETKSNKLVNQNV